MVERIIWGINQVPESFIEIRMNKYISEYHFSIISLKSEIMTKTIKKKVWMFNVLRENRKLLTKKVDSQKLEVEKSSAGSMKETVTRYI